MTYFNHIWVVCIYNPIFVERLNGFVTLKYVLFLETRYTIIHLSFVGLILVLLMFWGTLFVLSLVYSGIYVYI